MRVVRNMSDSLRRDVAWGFAAAGVSLVGALVIFWPLLSHLDANWSSRDIFSIYLDVYSWAGIFQGDTTHFGFPYGAEAWLHPSLGVLPNLSAHLFQSVTGSTFVGVNLTYLLSYLLTGGLTYGLMRLYTGYRSVALTFAVSFALLPYNVWRFLGDGHWLIAQTYPIPAALILATLIGSGRLPAFLGRREGEDDRLRQRMTYVSLGVLMVLSVWGNVYYAAFTVLLVVAALLWRFVRGDRWVQFKVTLLPLTGLFVLVFIAAAQAIFMVLTNAGALSTNTSRDSFDAALFAGSLTFALIPAALGFQGIFEQTGDLSMMANYVAHTGTDETGSPGQFGVIISTVSILAFISTWVLVQRRAGRTRSSLDRQALGTFQFVGYLTGIVLLFFMQSGLSYLLSLVATSELRSWARLLPVLLLLFMVGSAAAVDTWDGFQSSNVRRTVLAVAAACILVEQVLCGAALVTRADGAVNSSLSAAVTDAARAYEAQVNAAVPGDCGVMTLPYPKFPTVPNTNGITPGKIGLQALVNSEKQFASLAIDGSKTEHFLSDVVTKSPAEMKSILASKGFCVLHVEKDLIPENLDSHLAELETVFGAPIASGGLNSEWVAYRITG